MQAHARGFTLLELLTALGVVSIAMALGVPALLGATSRMRVNLAATETAAALRLVRMTAVRSRTHVAMRFEKDGGSLTWAVYGDGDGDGVRATDIRSGVDPQLQRPLAVRRVGSTVQLGFPPGPPPRDPSGHGRLGRLDDPIRFNRSNMVSFNAIGEATPGSLYLTDGVRYLAVVRVFGRSGKVKVMAYDPDSETWR